MRSLTGMQPGLKSLHVLLISTAADGLAEIVASGLTRQMEEDRHEHNQQP